MTLKEKQAIDEILKNYVKVYTIKGLRGWDTISVFRPKTMDPLPCCNMMDAIAMMAPFGTPSNTGGYRGFSFHNIDYGFYDFLALSRFSVRRKTVDIYICNILCAPHSKEAGRYVAEHGKEWRTALGRLSSMFDSRVYDREHGLKADVTVMNPERMYRKEKACDIAEGDVIDYSHSF